MRLLPSCDLPILVAARLSLSFPLLLSAVPLWAIDYEAERSKRKMRKCWFSDGGICSNFPIHLFDSFLPRWPTFGISLGNRGPYRNKDDQPAWLPQYHGEGRADSWDRFDDKGTPLGRLGGFLASVVMSAKDWGDTTGMRMPGVRDRVVRIRLDKGEGGLNLKMSGKLIARLTSYGEMAATAILAKFAPLDTERQPSRGWSEHRWVRFNVLIDGLRERLVDLRDTADLAHDARQLVEQISDAQHSAPLDGRDELPLTQEQADELKRLLNELTRVGDAFKASAIPQPYSPTPRPSIRVRPPL